MGIPRRLHARSTLTDEEEGFKYEHDLWQKVEIEGAERRQSLAAIEQLARQRGVSQ